MDNNKMYKMEEKEMSDINTESLLLARGVGYGGYGGVWGGGYGGYGPFASPSANAIRLDRNAQATEDQADCTRAVLGLGLDNINSNFENATRQREFSDLREGQFRAELRTNDRLRDLEREINANARVAADCCCDLKVQAANDKAEILSKMEALSKEGIARDLDRAERQVIALQTQIACGCTTGCSKPCS